jgi:peroxiredoxin
MPAVAQGSPLQPGQVAPDFTLAAVEREGTVSLANYRGRSAVLLTINRGLWCSFCRRHILPPAHRAAESRPRPTATPRGRDARNRRQ